MRRALSWLTYPLMTGGGVAFCFWALRRGWPAWAIAALVITAASVLIEGIERVIPWSHQWQQPHGDLRTDLWHLVISNRAFELGSLVTLVALVPLGRQLGLALWPRNWPLIAQASLALVLLDLPWYWLHRMQHTSPLLWRLHSVHHSAERLYWWNVARSHPIENLYTAAASMAPLALLGVPDEALALLAAFSGVHSTLMHSNADLRTGPLDLVLNTARVHRWHHSPREHESFANFSPTLTLWDWVFGTRRFDRHATPPQDVGLSRIDFPRAFLAQMRAPFDPRLWRRR